MNLYQDEIRCGQTADDVKIPGSYLSEESTSYGLLNRWSGYALTVDGGSTSDYADIIQSSLDNYNYQKFTLQDNGGYKNIITQHGNKAVDCITQSEYQAARQMTLQAGYRSQQWNLVDRSNGYYSLINRWSGYALTAPNKSSGTIMVQQTYNSSWWSQQWQLISQSSPTNTD
jgi:hypothetical protein